jgi:hypothetical protein
LPGKAAHHLAAELHPFLIDDMVLVFLYSAASGAAKPLL